MEKPDIKKGVDPKSVMCVKATDVGNVGQFTGLQTDWNKYLTSLFRPEKIHWLDRARCEADRKFKQIIPYMMLRYRSPDGVSIGVYQRTKLSGESRLHGKWTLGLGGHIEFSDRGDTPMDIFQAAWQRELKEEVKIDCRYAAEICGLISDPSTPVGQVHLGVLMVIDVQLPAVYPNDEEVAHLHFVPLKAAVRHAGTHERDFETWSRIVLTNSAFVQRLTDESSRDHS